MEKYMIKENKHNTDKFFNSIDTNSDLAKKVKIVNGDKPMVESSDDNEPLEYFTE